MVDELPDRLRGRGVRHAHQVGLRDQHRHRRKVGDGIVAQLRIQELVGGHSRAGDEDRIAVGIRMGDHVGGDVAAGARFVLHHHRLAPDLLQAVADQTRGDVGRTARRERHHHADRFGGPVGAERAGQQQRRCGHRGRGETGKTAAVQHGRNSLPKRPPDCLRSWFCSGV
jgi:hypothetical protein